MKMKFSRLTGQITLCAALATMAFGDPLEQTGLLPLRSMQPALDGAGVKVAVPEGNLGDAWQISPAAVGQPESKFRWISSGGTATTFPNGLGTESDHANIVGKHLFGISGGMAPGVDQIDNYLASHFVESIIFAAVPPSIEASIVNQSFVFPSQDANAEKRFDNYAATHNVLFVSGVGNGGTVLPPGTAYNGIGVGVSDGSSSTGPTVNGRCKPDIVAPGSATSYAAPYVSGAAALLLQAARNGAGGADTNAAADIRTLKALLLNGAVKPAGWTNHPAHPLDMRHGSGVLNVLNSWKQLAFGKQPFVEAASAAPGSVHPPGSETIDRSPVGWDFNTITNLRSEDRIHHYYFVVPTNSTGHRFTATLTWNRASGSNGINNLDLFLYDYFSGSPIAMSTSLVDNVEHIHVPNLPPGRYNLQVWKSADFQTVTETYALAYEAVSSSLEIHRTQGGMELSWPVYPHGFTLESAAFITSPTWNPVVGSPELSGERFRLPLPTGASGEYYRLRQP